MIVPLVWGLQNRWLKLDISTIETVSVFSSLMAVPSLGMAIITHSCTWAHSRSCPTKKIYKEFHRAFLDLEESWWYSCLPHHFFPLNAAGRGGSWCGLWSLVSKPDFAIFPYWAGTLCLLASLSLGLLICKMRTTLAVAGVLVLRWEYALHPW